MAHLIKQMLKSVFQLSQMKQILDEKSQKAFGLGKVQSHLDHCSPI